MTETTLEERARLVYSTRDPAVLAKLATESDYVVRCRVAMNSATPADVLAKLAGDTDADVRRMARANPSFNPEAK